MGGCMCFSVYARWLGLCGDIVRCLYIKMSSGIKPGIDGLYAVCFFNDKAYDENKVWEIFGRYGRVLSVRFTGQDGKVLVFVRYKEYQEAKHCLEDLNKTNELSVKIAVPSKKLTKVAEKQQNGTSKFSGDSYSYKNQFSGWNSTNYKKPFHKNFKQDNEQTRYFHPKPGNCHIENENSLKNFEGANQDNEVPKEEDPVHDKTVSRHTELQSDDDTQGAGDTKRRVSDGNRGVKHVEKEDTLKSSDSRGQMLQNSDASNGGNNQRKTDTDTCVPITNTSVVTSIKKYPFNGIIDDGLPPLIDSEDLPDYIAESPKVYAKDVIIANLPPTVDEWDVICLARSYDLSPVHVSAVQRTGIKYNIPFCHLWMENDYEADMAEDALGGTCMEGKVLLVARAEKLLSAFYDNVPELSNA